jgi:O-antigen/teichoic acid export membrane protein
MPFGGIGSQPSGYRAVLLFLFTLGNYALMYVANILLARSLKVNEFDDYNVAISIVTMLSTIATLGLEKYALRAISLFKMRQDWGKFRGFWLFSIKIIAGFSLLLFFFLSGSLEAILALRSNDYHIAIVILAVFLPVIAVSLFLVEVISAQGAQILSIAVYRLFLPLLYVLLIGGFVLKQVGLTATIAVLCYGAAWLSSFSLLWLIANSLITREIKQAVPLIFPKKWLGRSLPLVFNSLMMTIMTSGGVIILEILFPSSTAVGTYAVAVQTGGFISLIGTSTNRYYLPSFVVLIEQNEHEKIARLIKHRVLVVGGLILMLFILVSVFAHQILAVFGDKFSDGYMSLIILAAGASFSGLFADMPYILQYMGYNKLVLGLTFLATLSMVSLGFYFGSIYGTVGVAMAYALPVMVIFISFRIMVGIRLA